MPKRTRSPTVPSTDARGYGYVENAQWWKDACAKLPCFEALKWPDYDTKVIEERIDGKDVVIQLWKGWCQRFLGRTDFPGGMGAEVGVYRRLPTRKKLTLPPGMAGPLLHVLKAGTHAADHDIWWPYEALGTTLTFDFVNPVKGEVVFSAGPEETYWLCKWMNEDSYLKYKRSCRGSTPDWAARYRLDFTVNGKKYSW